MIDLLIKNGLIIDGTGRERYASDVAVQDGIIIDIDQNIKADVKQVLDVEGCVVSPGFIDSHGHSDFTLFINHRGESKIRQGITTEVTGNCGFTSGPITNEHYDDQVYYLANTIVLDEYHKRCWHWNNQDEFLEFSARKGLSFNVAPLIGQGMIHVGVMGFEDRIPLNEELNRMVNMLKTDLDRGFFGMSMAFEYEPGNYIKDEEVLRLCKVIKEYDCIYAIHMRNEGKDLITCVKHAVEICRRTGARVEISHLKARYNRNWGKAVEALKIIDAAREEGLDIAFDVYPYVAYGSGLIDLIPPWVKKDGPRIMCERLRDPELRRKAIYDMKHGIEGWESIMQSENWGDCVQIAMLKTQMNKKYEGMTISQIAADMECTCYEAVIKLMVDEDASIKCIWFAMNENELIKIMKHPNAIFGTDGRACDTYSELSQGAVHPRYYGTYPRIMGHYVRKLGVFSLEEAVMKSTMLPAQRFGIKKRGILRKGFFADLVVFRPDIIAEKGTFTKPHQYPVGIEYVIVNGQIVIDHDKHTGNLPGLILRKMQQ